ncbi:AraC family transcriptional regulator [Luteimonas sp. FCS-9]|uniref:AraC family transcriptional regulator n=1 Tax=Luteimonas sp. FCS-9 TaxID=1547516 RepID=UPI00063EB2DB|nr:AraC family transcriptional regulator [Luteimonas sp. FCS-9]KLJ00376.1 AraC family transcriptional regulator [Luteimonas sp. FCS-9]
MSTLLDLVRGHADAHAPGGGIAATPIAGLSTVHALAPSGLGHDIQRPLACLVLQGAKEVTMGARTFAFAAGDTLVIAADLPTESRIVQASAAAPYCSLVLEIDPAVVADLVADMDVAPDAGAPPIGVEPTDAELAEAALQLMRLLLVRPSALPVLQAQRVREMHYWLLAGRHGPAIRRLAWPNGSAQRVARAVAALRAGYDRPLPVERLAALSDMSVSAFHAHFRAATSLTPLQFQKRLRLIEARRRMLADGVAASVAAHGVGYASVPQFTREYARMFGQPPTRETDAARQRAQAG